MNVYLSSLGVLEGPLRFSARPSKGTWFKTLTYTKDIENVPLRGPEKFPLKNLFFPIYSCYNSYFQSFCYKENKFVDPLCLFTYIDYVSSFVSGSFRRTITYIKGLWSFTRTEIFLAANIHFVGNLSISKTFCKDNVAGKNEENRISLYVIIWRQITMIWLTCCGCCCNSFGINDFINFFHSPALSIYTMMALFTSHVATQLCHSCYCKIIYIYIYIYI